MFRKLIGAVVGLALAGILTADPSSARVTYKYFGPNFSGASGIYDTSMSISGYFRLDKALEQNVNAFFTHTDTTGTASILKSFYFTDGINTISQQNSTAYGIRVFTDGDGAVSDWRADIQKFNRDNPALLHDVMIITCTTGGGICGEYASIGLGGGDFTSLGIATNGTGRGTWLITPIPAALPLFATALAGMGFIGWRRKRMTA